MAKSAFAAAFAFTVVFLAATAAAQVYPPRPPQVRVYSGDSSLTYCSGINGFLPEEPSITLAKIRPVSALIGQHHNYYHDVSGFRSRNLGTGPSIYSAGLAPLGSTADIHAPSRGVVTFAVYNYDILDSTGCPAVICPLVYLSIFKPAAHCITGAPRVWITLSYVNSDNGHVDYWLETDHVFSEIRPDGSLHCGNPLTVVCNLLNSL